MLGNMKKIHLLYLLFSFAALAVGCATTPYSRGHKALEQERYDDAVRELRQAISENMSDAKAVRDMGIAVYHKGKTDLAVKFLRLAATRLPNDITLAYYLGRAYEDKGEIADAIQMYSRYADLSPFNDIRQEIEGRLLVLVRQQVRENLKLLIQQEEMLNVSNVPDLSVAVLYFTDMSNKPEMTPLQKGLTDLLITDLSQIESLVVVERARLQQLFEEMSLGMTGLVDEATVARMGKLLGAAQVVHGTLLPLGDQSLRVDAALSNIKTNESTSPQRVSGALQDLLSLEKDLVFGIIDQMGIELGPEERNAIEKRQTKDLLAFMSFCRGLDYEDRQLWDQARQEYGNALQRDSGFDAAKGGLQRVEAFENFARPVGKASLAELKSGLKRAAGAGSTPQDGAGPNRTPRIDEMAGQTAPPLLGSRLQRTAHQVSAGFVPSVQQRKPLADETSPSFGTSTPITIRIPLPVRQ